MSGGPITRRRFVKTAGASGIAAVAAPASLEPFGGRTAQSARVIDGAATQASPDLGVERFAAYARAARAAGVDVALVPIARLERLEATLRNLARLREYAVRLGDVVRVLGGAEDIRGAGAARLGLVPVLHGFQMVEERLDLLPGLRASGVRTAQLNSGWRNYNGDGCFESSDLGLTGLGRMAVRALEDAGIVMDLARSGRRSALEAAELASRPVVVSCANAAAVHPHPANLSDEQISAVAGTGGVIGLTVFPEFVARGRGPRLEDFLRHVDHVVGLAGVEHVGFGFGFEDRPLRRFEEDPLPDPPYAFPAGFHDIGALPTLRQALAARGYDPPAVDALMGANFARVLALA